MGIRLKSSKILSCTHRLVEHFATMTPAKCDRPLNPRRMEFLKKEIEAGRFFTPRWVAIYCLEDKVWYRGNGKHTSTLLSQMNGTAPKDLKVCVDQFEVDTLKDVAELYATFDSRSGVRSLMDIVRIVSATDPDLEGVSMKVITNAVSGISFAEHFGRDNTMCMYEKAKKIIDHKQFVLWLSGAMLNGSRESKHMRKAPVVAVMLKTFTKDKRAATEFWDLVRMVDGGNGSAPKRLALWLKDDANLSSGRGAKSGDKEAVTHREMFARCILQWNLWRAGKAGWAQYVRDAELPEVK